MVKCTPVIIAIIYIVNVAIPNCFCGQLVFNENKWHKFALTLALMSTATQLLLPQTTPPKADLRDPQPTIKWSTQSLHASALFKTHFFVNNSLKQTQRLRPELKIDVAVI